MKPYFMVLHIQQFPQMDDLQKENKKIDQYYVADYSPVHCVNSSVY